MVLFRQWIRTVKPAAPYYPTILFPKHYLLQIGNIARKIRLDYFPKHLIVDIKKFMYDEVAERQNVVPRQLLVLALKAERDVLYTFAHDFEVANDRILHELVLRELIICIEIGSVGMNLLHGRKHGIQKEIIAK